MITSCIRISWRKIYYVYNIYIHRSSIFRHLLTFLGHQRFNAISVNFVDRIHLGAAKTLVQTSGSWRSNKNGPSGLWTEVLATQQIQGLPFHHLKQPLKKIGKTRNHQQRDKSYLPVNFLALILFDATNWFRFLWCPEISYDKIWRHQPATNPRPRLKSEISGEFHPTQRATNPTSRSLLGSWVNGTGDPGILDFRIPWEKPRKSTNGKG